MTSFRSSCRYYLCLSVVGHPLDAKPPWNVRLRCPIYHRQGIIRLRCHSVPFVKAGRVRHLAAGPVLQNNLPCLAQLALDRAVGALVPRMAAHEIPQ